MKKKDTLIVLGFGGLIAGFALRHLPISLCMQPYEFGGKLRCFDKLPFTISDILLAFTPIVIFFALITYFLREEVLRAWSRLTYWYVPTSIALILVANDRPSGGGFILPSTSTQELVAILLWGLYVIISTILIIWKYFATRQGK